MWTSADRNRLDTEGFLLRHGVASEAVIDDLARAIEATPPAGGTRARRGSVIGMRNLLQVPAVRRFANRRRVRGLVEPILGPEAFAVRGIFFDKTAEANWRLRWHQDEPLPAPLAWHESVGASSD